MAKRDAFAFSIRPRLVMRRPQGLISDRVEPVPTRRCHCRKCLVKRILHDHTGLKSRSTRVRVNPEWSHSRSEFPSADLGRGQPRSKPLWVGPWLGARTICFPVGGPCLRSITAQTTLVWCLIGAIYGLNHFGSGRGLRISRSAARSASIKSSRCRDEVGRNSGQRADSPQLQHGFTGGARFDEVHLKLRHPVVVLVGIDEHLLHAPGFLVL